MQEDFMVKHIAPDKTAMVCLSEGKLLRLAVGGRVAAEVDCTGNEDEDHRVYTAVYTTGLTVSCYLLLVCAYCFAAHTGL